MQKQMDGKDGGKFRKINPAIETTITTMKDQSTGIVPALEILQIGYNEMKEHLNQTSSSMSATTIATDITKGLEELENLFKVDHAIEQDNDSRDDQPTTNYSTRRRDLKKKAFVGEPAHSSEPPKKKISMTYRTSITDDGEYIKIQKAKSVKPKKPLNGRDNKTVIKQLEVPM